MPQIENHLSISVLAPARPQLALDLFKAIRERGCDVEDCRFAPIGDRLAASLVVSGNWSALGRLETALPGLATKLDLKVQFTRCGPRAQNPEFRAYAVDVVAPQQQDLLLHLLEFFHAQDVDVAEVCVACGKIWDDSDWGAMCRECSRCGHQELSNLYGGLTL